MVTRGQRSGRGQPGSRGREERILIRSAKGGKLNVARITETSGNFSYLFCFHFISALSLFSCAFRSCNYTVHTPTKDDDSKLKHRALEKAVVNLRRSQNHPACPSKPRLRL